MKLETTNRTHLCFAATTLMTALVLGCSDDASTDAGAAGSAGASGSGATGGISGSAGSAGSAGAGGRAGSAGAGGSGGAPVASTLAIAGVYDDDFGGGHEIDESVWLQGVSGSVSSFAVTQFDNDNRVLIAQNDDNNDFNPGLWSRFDWTRFDGALYFCQSLFDGASEADAVAATPADATDPTSTGCGGFGWSQLIGPEISSTYRDDFDTTHAVSPRRWLQSSSSGSSAFEMRRFDNTAEFLVARNSPDNEFNPDLWSRFEWTTVMGDLYFCQVSFDSATEADALAAGPADPSDPPTSGCGGFSWSRLAEVAEIFGSYDDDFGTVHDVADSTWTQTTSSGTSSFAISSIDNARDMLVAQNAASNAFNPDLWSRFDWATFAGELYFCQSAFDAPTEAAALATAAPDATDPTADGCGGFAWSRLVLK